MKNLKRFRIIIYEKKNNVVSSLQLRRIDNLSVTPPSFFQLTSIDNVCCHVSLATYPVTTMPTEIRIKHNGVYTTAWCYARKRIIREFQRKFTIPRAFTGTPGMVQNLSNNLCRSGDSGSGREASQKPATPSMVYKNSSCIRI